ncbi:HAD family hydrolase [Shouchella shacheensis]|uniref:HAD family hydrolase n=1 Tax=Shouchella shacheensis TaxID=1649580 RepID=UPI00073FB60A|nr:HAD family phosphatase [Shouchella shacheensis]
MSKAFIFDMDGVIIDSEPLHQEVELDACERFGIPVGKEGLEPYVGMRTRDMWMAVTKEHDAADQLEEILAYAEEEKRKRLEHSEDAAIAGIPELLEDLQQNGYKIGLGSSSPRAFILAVLTKLKIKGCFHVIVSGEEVENGKPDPDVYLEVARQLHVDPSNCTVLEDSTNGVAAGHAAGMKTIGFQNPNSGNQDVAHADIVVQQIAEIDVKGL